MRFKASFSNVSVDEDARCPNKVRKTVETHETDSKKCICQTKIYRNINRYRREGRKLRIIFNNHLSTFNTPARVEYRTKRKHSCTSKLSEHISYTIDHIESQQGKRIIGNIRINKVYTLSSQEREMWKYGVLDGIEAKRSIQTEPHWNFRNGSN